MALVSASATSPAIRQQWELLWQDKTERKLIRESLETTVWTTAKLKLADFLKGEWSGETISPSLFSEAVELFKRGLRAKPISSHKAKNTGCGAFKEFKGHGRNFGKSGLSHHRASLHGLGSEAEQGNRQPLF